MTAGAALVRANALALPFADESVDLVVTSPPFWKVRTYEDDGRPLDGQLGSEATMLGFLEGLWAVMAEVKRVMRPEAPAFVNLGDKYVERAGPGRPMGHYGDQDHPRYRKAERPERGGTDGLRAKSLMGIPWSFANGCTSTLAKLGGPDPGLDLILRAEVVWEKPNGLPESVTDRPRRSHEQWFMFTKRPMYGTAIDDLREPQQTAGERHEGSSGYQNATGDIARGYTERTLNPLGRLPGSVWSIGSEPLRAPDYFVEDETGWRMLSRKELWRWMEHRWRVGDYRPVRVAEVDHFAAFPTEWPRRLVTGFSPAGICLECGHGRWPRVDEERVGDGGIWPREGKHSAITGRRHDEHTQREHRGYHCACAIPSAPTRPAVVLDPFSGTGTTAMVARALDRFGVGCDLSADYLRLARWRIWQSDHGAKVRARSNRDRQQTLGV